MLRSMVISSTGRTLLHHSNLKCQRGPNWSPIILQCGHFSDLVTFKGKMKGEKTKDKGDGLTKRFLIRDVSKHVCIFSELLHSQNLHSI